MSSDSLHGNAPLGVQNFKHALDARLAERAEAPQKGSAVADIFHADGQRFDNIGAAVWVGRRR